MISITKIQRQTPVIPYLETVIISHNSVAEGIITVTIEDASGVLYDGYILSRSVGQIICREIPYMLGVFKFRVHQGTDTSASFEYTPSQVDNDGIPLPFTVQISHSKNKNPIAKSSQILGGHHVFDNIYDFLCMPHELMEPTMSITVKCVDGVVRTYTLDSIPEDSVWPLKDADVGVIGSFRNYWLLQSEAKKELSYVTESQYAPDFNGGIPPFYENPTALGTTDRYSFPIGTEWDDEREFTLNSWVTERTEKHTWKRVKESG